MLTQLFTALGSLFRSCLGRAGGWYPLVAAIFVAAPVASTAQDPAAPAQLRYLEGAESAILSVEYGIEGKTIVGATAQGKILFWDSIDNQLIAGLSAYTGPILSAATSPNGFQVATGGRDGVVKIYDIPAALPLATIPGFSGIPTCVAVSADGSLMLTGDQSKAVRLWNAENNQNLRSFTAVDVVTDVAMDTERRSVFAMSADGSLQGWNLDGGQDLGRIMTVPANAAALHPEGHTLVAAGKDGVLRVMQWPIQPKRDVVQHAGIVATATISADDRLMVTGSHDQSVRLLNAETGAAIHTLAGHVGQAVSSAMSFDSQLVAAGNNTGTIRFWQAADGADAGTLEGHDGAVRALAFHPAQSQIASAGEDGTLRVWNVPQPGASLTGHSGAVLAGRISHGGTVAATVSADQTLRLWNLVEGTQAWATTALGQPLQRLAFSPDDQQIATADAKGNVRLHNAADGAVQMMRGAHATAITGIAYDALGQRLVTSGLDGLVKVWTLPGVGPQVLAEFGSGANCLAFVDEKQLAVAAPDGTIHVGAKQIKIDEAATVIAISPDRKLIAVGTATGNVKVRVIATGAEAFQLTGHQGAVNALAFHPREAKIATAGADGSIGVWDIPATLPAEPIDEPLLIWAGHASGVTTLAFTPDGSGIVSGGGDFAVKHWKSIDGVAIRSMSHGAVVTALAIVNNGTEIVSGSADKTVRRWNLSNGSQLASVAVPTQVQRMAVSEDGARVVTSGEDHVIRVWEMESGRELERFEGHTAAIQSLALSGDKQTILSASTDQSVRQWTISAEQLIVADAAKIHALALTGDGKYIITAGEDRLVKQWDLAGKMVRQFGGAPAPVRCVAISADAKQIVGGGDPAAGQQNLIVWNLADGRTLKTVPTATGIVALAFHGDDKVVVTGADKHLRVFSTESGLLLQDWLAANVLGDVSVGLDQRTILAVGPANTAQLYYYSLAEILNNHTGAATGIAFTPDGNRLVSCGVDKTVRLWNRKDGSQLAQFVGSAAAVQGLALSANGQRLVAAGDDQVVRVWEMPGANPQPQLQPLISFPHPSIVRAVSITNDGGVVAAAGDDNMVRLWDVTTGKVREQLAGHTGAVHAVQLSGDGTTILSGGADNYARQFFPTVIATAIADNAALNDVTFSGDGASVLTVGTGNSAKQWKVTPTNVPVAAVVDPDEPAPDADGVEPTWPASRGTWLRGKLEVVREFPGATKALTSVAASRDGQYLVTSSDDAQLRLYALLDGAPLAAVQSPSGIASIAISADGTTVMAGGADQIVRNYQSLKDGDGWQLALFQESLSHTAAVVDVALASEATTLATVGADSTLQRWLAPSASPRASFAGHAGPVYGLSWRSDGELLASASGDGTVVVREVISGEVVFRCKGHQGQVNGVAFQPAGKELASCGADRTIRIWSAELPPLAAAGEEAPAADVAAEPAPVAGAQLAMIEKDIEDTLYGITYSHDGNYLMAGGMSKTWRQWQRGGEEPLQPTRSLLLHNHAIYRVAASPSSARFATLDTSGKLMIWNTSQGNLDFHQQLPTTKAYNFAYSPNSQEILVATSDHRVIRILLPPHAR